MRPARSIPVPARRAPRLSFREIVTLGLLAGIGVAGLFLAYRQLADLRRERDILFGSQQQEFVRLRKDNELLRQRGATRGPEAASDASTVAATSAPLSRDERMAELLAYAHFVTSRPEEPIERQARTLSQGRQQLPLVPDEGPAFVIDRESKLHRNFGELFALEAPQVAQLQQAIDETGRRIADLTAGYSSVRANGDGSYTLDVKALPRGIVSAERGRLIEAFLDVLGGDGYQAFELLNASTSNSPTPFNGLAGLFNFFGSSERTAVISKTRDGYEYKIGGDRFVSGSGAVGSLDAMQNIVGGGVRLLPAGF